MNKRFNGEYVLIFNKNILAWYIKISAQWFDNICFVKIATPYLPVAKKSLPPLESFINV